MMYRNFILAFFLYIIGCQVAQADSFREGNGEFLLNGEPYVIRAAELHYPRIPKEYWDQRIKLTKALGMNTICLYTFWNIHEPKEGEFNFKGQNDLRAFIKLCEENDMKVILRPGPYVCAEWEMGGLPWWLLKKQDIRLRENDPYFMERVEQFQNAVASEVADLTIDKGGPIIMIQVENEYGSYGEDKEYISAIRDILRKNFGDEIAMFQCDWASNFTLNGLDDLIWTMNFGTGTNIDSQFKDLKSLRPESPLMCSEFWSGWFDKWGAAHETRPADAMLAGIEEMLEKGISYSLYMTHGGTNWGHWAGANSPGYSPDVTSYDYDAPISESGQPTEKYWLLRQLQEKYLQEGESLAKLPELIKPIQIEEFELTEVAPLWDNLPPPIGSEEIKPIENFDMGFGSVIYSTELPEVEAGTILRITEPHDYAQVFINRELAGTLDRRKGEMEIVLEGNPEGSKLEIVVEAMGRINFGRAIKDNKGITDKVELISAEKVVELKGWDVYLLPDEESFYESFEFKPLKTMEESGYDRYPMGLYRGVFYVDNPSDTFLDFSEWGKGLVYVNGHGLGRIWEIGPQQTLYTPGVWLKEGENEILVFDIMGPKTATTKGIETPIIDRLKDSSESKDQANTENLMKDTVKVGEINFDKDNGWKIHDFENTLTCKSIILEIESTHDGDLPAIAELYLIGDNGKRLNREKWTVMAESEDLKNGNHSSDKIFDLQESTYWRPSEETRNPVIVRINLNESQKITGLEYLPRMEKGAPGAIKDIKVYITPGE